VPTWQCPMVLGVALELLYSAWRPGVAPAHQHVGVDKGAGTPSLHHPYM